MVLDTRLTHYGFIHVRTCVGAEGRLNRFVLVKKITVFLKFPLFAKWYGVNLSVLPSHLFLLACSLLNLGLLTFFFFFPIVSLEEKILFLSGSTDSVRNFLERCQYLLQSLTCSCLMWSFRQYQAKPYLLDDLPTL